MRADLDIREIIYDDPRELERMLARPIRENGSVVLGRFHEHLTDLAKEVMQSPYWQSRVVEGDYPQPGWVGREYMPERSVVFVLRNPAPKPDSYSDERNRHLMNLLRIFSSEPSVTNYLALSEAFRRDATNGDSPWSTWKTPVRGTINGILDSNEIAWLNLVKVRLDKECITEEDKRIGLFNLREEIKVLRPSAIIAVGRDSQDAVIKLGINSHTTFIPLELRESGVNITNANHRLSEIVKGRNI